MESEKRGSYRWGSLLLSLVLLFLLLVGGAHAKEGLSFAIDPVQILEHDDHRLYLTLSQQHLFHCLQYAAATQGRFQCLPLRILDWYFE